MYEPALDPLIGIYSKQFHTIRINIPFFYTFFCKTEETELDSELK